MPALSADEAHHEAAVKAAVREAVNARGGWLSFEDYMRIALYAPALGYYSAGSVKIGRAGDFVTAPELSTLFGLALARQCAQLLEMSGGHVLELGAGTGALAVTLLPALEALGALPARYEILEVSADLSQRQRERVSALPDSLRSRVHWRGALPEQFVGVCVANEVADALPFRRFTLGAEGYLEQGVSCDEAGELIMASRSCDPALAGEIGRVAASLPVWPVGYESELCALLDPWVRSLSDVLARGALLLIDYGLPRHEYYHAQRVQGTLRCHFRHRAHSDPLLHPGLQDITAWVDFTRLAEAAADAQLAISGYCTQAAFLLANGIEADVAAVQDTLQRARLAAEARILLLPGEMGEYFKVMALTRGLPNVPLRGFTLQDLRRSL